MSISFDEWKSLARRRLGDERFAYLSSGAGEGKTVEENYDAIRKWRFVPRVLNRVDDLSLQTRVLGYQIDVPMMLAPVGGQKYIHPDGEIASASAAEELKIPFILSNFGSSSIEEISALMRSTRHFMQLYPCNDDEVFRSFLKRAEDSGYSGVFLTVDMAGHPVQYFGPKSAEYEKFGTAVYYSDPVFRSRLKEPPERDEKTAHELWRKLRNARFTWEKLREIVKVTKLPVVIKGVMHVSDVEECINIGAAGVVVSNHGGRSLDSTVAPIDTLKEIYEVAKGKIAILFDSGVRNGVDVVKALALGADAVLVGRLYMYPLAAEGKKGVSSTLSLTLKEIAATLLSLGCTSVEELGEDLVRKSD